MNYYVLVGNRRTWKVSLEKKVWGFTEQTKGFWNTSEKEDRVLFYVTSPTKKIIGFGKFGKKFVDEEIIWPEEKLENKVIWKYKIKIKISDTVNQWNDGISLPKKIIVIQGRTKIQGHEFEKIIQQIKLIKKSK